MPHSVPGGDGDAIMLELHEVARYIQRGDGFFGDEYSRRLGHEIDLGGDCVTTYSDVALYSIMVYNHYGDIPHGGTFDMFTRGRILGNIHR